MVVSLVWINCVKMAPICCLRFGITTVAVQHAPESMERSNATLTDATIGNDRFGAATTLLDRSASVSSAGRSGRAGSGHTNGDRFFVQTNFETHAHVLLVMEEPDRILGVVRSSILHSSVTLRFAGCWIFLQLTMNNLAGSAEEPLEVPRTCPVIDVADKDSTNFGLDGPLTNVDMGSCG
jgi:hypothetical protein